MVKHLTVITCEYMRCSGLEEYLHNTRSQVLPAIPVFLTSKVDSIFFLYTIFCSVFLASLERTQQLSDSHYNTAPTAAKAALRVQLVFFTFLFTF